jgi:hypothetical protein
MLAEQVGLYPLVASGGDLVASTVGGHLLLLAPRPRPTVTVTASPSVTKPIAHLNGNDTTFVVWIVVIVALLWGALLLIDLLFAYWERRRQLFPILTDLVKEASKNGLTSAELTKILSAISKGPTGVRGLGRISIAATVATVIAVVLVLLIIYGDSSDQDLVKIILGGLVAAFTTIIGFYFGAKSAGEAAEAGADAAGPAGGGGTTHAGETTHAGGTTHTGGTTHANP